MKNLTNLQKHIHHVVDEKNIIIIFGYDGSFFKGSQKQSKQLTIQNEIENFFQVKIKMFSRTDADVNAISQLAQIKFDFNINEIELKKWFQSFNQKFNFKIKINQFFFLDKGIDLKDCILSRTYLYIFLKKPIFYINKLTVLPENFNIHTFIRHLKEFQGKKDFRNFSTKPSSKTFIREIKNISLDEEEDKILIRITADGFLRKMIRHILGHAYAKTVHIGFKLISPYGLFLEKINLTDTIKPKKIINVD